MLTTKKKHKKKKQNTLLYSRSLVFQSKDSGGKLFTIHSEEHFLNIFIKVSQLFGVSQVQRIDDSQHHCTSSGYRSDIVQNDDSLNKNANIIIMSSFFTLLVDDKDAHGVCLYVSVDIISLDVLYVLRTILKENLKKLFYTPFNFNDTLYMNFSAFPAFLAINYLRQIHYYSFFNKSFQPYGLYKKKKYVKYIFLN